MGAVSVISPSSILLFPRSHLRNYNYPISLPSLLRNRRMPIQNPKSPNPRFVVFAEKGIQREEGNSREEGEEKEDPMRVPQRRPPVFNLRWRDLLDPDPENIVAIGLTGLLAWASVQVLWQLFFISIAILLAAIKYSFIAALLLFILITLL